MIRLWNYNKSRIHSYRGARYIEMSIEDCGGRNVNNYNNNNTNNNNNNNNSSSKVIFKGEIKRAPGGVFESYEDCCECILFTTNPIILSLIEKYDPLNDNTTNHSTDETSSKGKNPLPSFLRHDTPNNNNNNINSERHTLEPSSNMISMQDDSVYQSPSKSKKFPHFSPSLLLSPSSSAHTIPSINANTQKSDRKTLNKINKE